MIQKHKFIPDNARRIDNADGSTTYRWKDKEGFNSYTYNLPPTPPIYHDPRAAVPIPAQISKA